MDTIQAPRPRRADAVRNYDALLQAALSLFTERGSDVSLEEIAASAGVGIGTLYRNFPSREALAVAAYRQGVEQLCEAADTLLADNDAEQALELWLKRFVSYIATKQSLIGVLKAEQDKHGDLFGQVRSQMLGAVTMLLAKAAATGRIRKDVHAEDLLRAVGGICLVNGRPDWQDQTLRLLDLLMDGLRYGAAVPARTSA